MAGGIEMLLKSMGLDPEGIKTSVNEFGQIIIALKEQMDRVEAKLDAIMTPLPDDQEKLEEIELMTQKNGVN